MMGERVVQRAVGLDVFHGEAVDAGEGVEGADLVEDVVGQLVHVGGEVVVDDATYTARIGGRPLDLTYKEFELLKYLVGHPGRVLTRDLLLSDVWGYDYYGGTRTVDVHIRRLRAKVGPEYEGHIQTVRSVGYRFQAER